MLTVSLYPILYNSNAAVVKNGYCILVFPSMVFIDYQLTVHFVAPLVCILAMNVAIFYTANQHTKIMQKFNLLDSKEIEGLQQLGSYMRRVISANKAGKVMLVLVGVFLFCWLTFIVVVSYNFLCGNCLQRETVWIANSVNYAAIGLNPMLYGLLNPKVRNLLVFKLKMGN